MTRGRRLCPAWAGIDLSACTPACPPGTFGESCGQKCRCAGGNQACHPASGACTCAAGYHGPGCQQRECCLGRPPGRPRARGEGEMPGPCAGGTQPHTAARSLQGAHQGALGLVVSSRADVSTGPPVMLPPEPATAPRGSWGPTAASVSGRVRAGGSLLRPPVCQEDSPDHPPLACPLAPGWAELGCPAGQVLRLCAAPPPRSCGVGVPLCRGQQASC